MSVSWIEWAGIAVSVSSAGVAGWQAHRARLSEQESERLRFAEERVASHRYDVYEPMVTILGAALRGKPLPDDFVDMQDKFLTWQLVFGSDEAIRAYGRLMQTIYEDAPAEILVRMYIEFFIAVRRDLGDPTTTLQNLDVMAPRINNLYKDRNYHEALTLPLAILFRQRSWQPPWERPVGQMSYDLNDDQSSQPAGNDEEALPPPPPVATPAVRPHTTPRPGARARRRQDRS